jgi:hypothetical protein
MAILEHIARPVLECLHNSKYKGTSQYSYWKGKTTLVPNTAIRVNEVNVENVQDDRRLPSGAVRVNKVKKFGSGNDICREQFRLAA